jgi:hypothetical protein
VSYREAAVLGLIGILVLTGLVLAVGLWAGTLFLQGYIYSEPVAKIYWRAPAAAAVLAAFYGLWTSLEYRNPGNYPGQFQFTSSDDRQVPELWSVNQGKETHYVMRKSARGLPEYLDKEAGRPWQRSEAILIKEGEEKVRFTAEKDAKGHYKIDTGKSLRYVDPQGRVMTEDRLGQLSEARRGRLFGNIFLNLGHLAVWFLAAWLILRFQWTHALGVAVVFWLLMTLAILPMILTQAEAAAKRRPSTQQAREVVPPGLARARVNEWDGLLQV